MIMKLFAKLCISFQQPLVRLIRLVLFSILFLLIVYQIENGITPKIEVFLINILIIIEIFFRFRICKAVPGITVDKNNGKEIFESFSLDALIVCLNSVSSGQILQKLFKFAQIKYFMNKAIMTKDDLKDIDLPVDAVYSSAIEVAKTFHGKFVTVLDLFVAILMLSENDTKLMFAKQLKLDDFGSLVPKIRSEFDSEENPKKLRFHISGGGIGEFLITGWTPETKKYTRNFTGAALSNKALITGREKEFKTLLEGLIRAENNNVLIVGNPGSGRENLVKAFAWHSFEDNIGSVLNSRTVLELMPGAFMAGAINRSELETRLLAIIEEISHSGNVILYIPEFQNLMGATSYNLDISGALMPHLQSGKLPIIATISKGSYKTYLDRNPIKEVFTLVELRETDINTAIKMVMDKVIEIERKNKVIISYRAIVSAVELAERYLHDLALPGSAVSLLMSVSNKVALSDEHYFNKSNHKMVRAEHVVKFVEDMAHVVISIPDKKEIDILLHLENKLHERVIAQHDAVVSIAEAMRRVRSGISISPKPVSFLFLGPTGVGKTETAKALSEIYYGGEGKMLRFDMSEYNDEAGMLRLLGAPPGKGDSRGEITDKVRDNPSSLVLLDEFEKANPKVHDLFLQVLDDGRLTDNKGETVSFRNSLIIATSNAGSEFIREQIEKGAVVDKQFRARLLNHLQTNKIFKPELMNRFDDIVVFKPLSKDDIRLVIDLMLKKLISEMAKQDIEVKFDDAVIGKIAAEGYDPQFGARPLRRYIQSNIEDLLARGKLNSTITRGKKVSFVVDGTNNINLSVN